LKQNVNFTVKKRNNRYHFITAIVLATVVLYVTLLYNSSSSPSFTAKDYSFLNSIVIPSEPISPNIENCELFDNGNINPINPNITSIFNCNSKYGECQYFYPSKFFHSKCGIGKVYAKDIEYMETLRRRKQLWMNGPPIVLPWVSINTKTTKINKQVRKVPFRTHNISMVHVHKTGGTSLVVQFGTMVRNFNAKGTRLTSYQPMKQAMKQHLRTRNNRQPPQSEKQYDKKRQVYESSSRNQTRVLLDGACKYKEKWGERDHLIFAVVRDPAERFISAIGQATGAYGSGSNGVASQLRNECITNDNSQETLRCFVNLVKTNGTWIEVHFTPMAYELSFATLYKDVPVAIFPFSQVPALMVEFNGNPQEKKKNGSLKGFRKSNVLTEMSMKDYDKSMLQDLCEIYKVDVLFLWHIGYATHCDKYVNFQ